MIVFAHYYYPDMASTGQILKDLCEGLCDTFNITVITVVPSYTGKIEDKYKNKFFYEEKINGIDILRVRVPEFSKEKKLSRIFNIMVYFFGAIFASFKVKKVDIIYTISQPPILGGVLGLITKLLKKSKFVYNIQDFNPEQIEAVDYLRNKTIIKLLRKIDNLTCKSADKVIVVGRDMQETLSRRFQGHEVPVNTFINNWTDEKEIYPLRSLDRNVSEFKETHGIKNKFIIQYSGNIGLYYDLENIIKVIAKFSEFKDVIFLFIGEGSMKDRLLKYSREHSLENVKFLPYQDKNDLIYSLNAGDLHWVVNAKGIKGVSVPSKLYGVLASGKPVIGVLEKGSEARLIIQDSDSGLLTEPGDYEQIEELIKYAIKNQDVISEMGRNGRKYLEENLTKEVSISKYKEELLML